MNKKYIPVILGIITAILLSMLMLLVQGYNPIESYKSILSYSVFSLFGISNTLNRMGILLIVGLSAAIALGSGVSNLGQFGQILIGAIVATVVALYVDLPKFMLIPLILASGIIAGALYAFIAALLKKLFGMSEFITTLMLNFIANYFTQYLVTNPLMDPNSSWPMSYVVSENAILPSINKLDTSIFIVLIVFIIVYIYVSKTREGYELKIMGKNYIFAKIGGCKTDINFYKVMLYSGALSGLAGALLIIGSAQQNRFLPNLGETFANDGLMVSIISNNSVLSLLFYALFFSVIRSGATGMQLDTGVPSEFTTMLIAVMVLSVVGFRSYSSIFLSKIQAIRKSNSVKK